MKKLLISLINLYQITPLHSHYRCRFIPTCCDYMKISIDRFGVFKGIYLGLTRILRCRPGGKSGIDMVPIKENK